MDPALRILVVACLLALHAGLAACGGPGPEADIMAYSAALQTIRKDPTGGFGLCEPIRSPELLDDCRLAALEGMARLSQETDVAMRLRCKALDRPKNRDECAFQLAEARHDADICRDAGSFASECRLHLLSSDFAAWVPRDALVTTPELHAALKDRLEANGIDPQDMRAWSAWFRWVLGLRVPLDLSRCARLPDPEQVLTCHETGKSLYQDRLNHARDVGSVPCHGGELPISLRFEPDSDLAAILDERLEELCR